MEKVRQPNPTDLFQQARKHPPLDREQEHELAKKSAAGDENSRNLLAMHNLSFVISIARRYSGRGVELDELIQSGVVGLLQSIQNFDPDRGTRLTTYSAWWIRAYINKHLREMGSCVKAETPTPGQPQSPLPRSYSLNDTVSAKEDGDTWQDRLECDGLSPEVLASRHQNSQQVRSSLLRLKKRLGTLGWAIIHKRLMTDEPATLAEVGRPEGLSRERVRQVENQVEKLLHRYLGDKIDPENDGMGG